MFGGLTPGIGEFKTKKKKTIRTTQGLAGTAPVNEPQEVSELFNQVVSVKDAHKVVRIFSAVSAIVGFAIGICAGLFIG